jgi:hypothetical protein
MMEARLRMQVNLSILLRPEWLTFSGVGEGIAETVLNSSEFRFLFNLLIRINGHVAKFKSFGERSIESCIPSGCTISLPNVSGWLLKCLLRVPSRHKEIGKAWK